MALTPQVTAALAQPAIGMFCAVRLTYPGFTLRLLDGAAVLRLPFDLDPFVGYDETYGALIGLENITDGGNDQAPRARLVMNPPSNAALAALASPGAQGSRVEIWEGVFNPATGLVIPDPDLAFDGEVDQPVYSPKSRNLTLDCSSSFEAFFSVQEGVRLTDSWHQSIWPGERGLEYQTAIRNSLPWGSEVARPVTQAAVRRALSLLRSAA